MSKKCSKKILLTGATGFLGSHILKKLVLNDYQVFILVRPSSSYARIKSLIEKVKIYQIKENDFELVFSENQIDIVIHCATEYGRGIMEFSSIVHANLFFSLKLLDYVRKYSIAGFINTDSFFNDENNYNETLLAYTLSKRHFIDYLRFCSQRENLKVINMKLFHVYGPNDNQEKFVPSLINQLKNGAQVHLDNPDHVRDFIFIDDVVDAYGNAIEYMHMLGYFNSFQIGTGIGTKIIKLVEIIKRILKHRKVKYETFSSKAQTEKALALDSAIADTERNSALNWSAKVSLDNGLALLLKRSNS